LEGYDSSYVADRLLQSAWNGSIEFATRAAREIS